MMVFRFQVDADGKPVHFDVEVQVPPPTADQAQAVLAALWPEHMTSLAFSAEPRGFVVRSRHGLLEGKTEEDERLRLAGKITASMGDQG